MSHDVKLRHFASHNNIRWGSTCLQSLLQIHSSIPNIIAAPSSSDRKLVIMLNWQKIFSIVFIYLPPPYNPLHGGIHKHSPTKEFTKILLHDSFIKVNNFECNLCGIQLKRLRIGYGLTVCWYSSAIICHNVIFPSCYPNILSLSLSIYSPAS